MVAWTSLVVFALFSLGYHGWWAYYNPAWASLQSQRAADLARPLRSTSLLEECEALHAQMADAAAQEHATRHSSDSAASLGHAAGAMVAWLMGGMDLLEYAVGHALDEFSDLSRWNKAAPRCAVEWLRQAQLSFDAARYHHAISHGRKALTYLRPAENEPSIAVTRSTALHLLSRALEAINNDTATPESARLLKEAAESGNANAMSEIAMQLEEGDPAMARVYYERSIAAGIADGGVASRRLGVLRLTGAGATAGAPDYAGASAAFEAGAHAGDADAAYNLGRMFEWRQAKTARMVETAQSSGAQSGEGQPAAPTSDSAEEGAKTPPQKPSLDGAPPTPPHAQAEHSQENAMLRIHATSEEDAKTRAEDEWRREALHWYAVAVDRGGVPPARFHLARLLLERNHPGDAALACDHFHRASEDGDVDSQWMLALMLRDGRGCDRDAKAAARWLTTAAEAGHPAAMEHLS